MEKQLIDKSQRHILTTFVTIALVCAIAAVSYLVVLRQIASLMP
jgi:hypothetical protein